MLLKYAQIRDVKIPQRGHATDAGIDFFIPKFDDDFIKDFESNEINKEVVLSNGEIVMPPHTNCLVNSGIKIEIPFGYMGMFANKSGVAAKNGLVLGAHIIDTFYSGELLVDVHNISNKNVILKEGQKLVQLILVPILNCDLTEVDENDLYSWMKDNRFRESGGFGSTGE